MAREIVLKITLDDSEINAKAGAAGRKIKSALDPAVGSLNSMRSAANSAALAFTALGVAAGAAFTQIAKAALQSAIDIDKTRQTIAALTGSVDSANKKIAELRKLSASSPGVTSSFATDLFGQFKALNTVADNTINSLIKSIGRLNAVFQIPDAKTFSRNLIQIFQGGFERDQIKEAIQAVPIFDQLLKEAFGTNDGEKLRKLKDAGKLTMDTFLQGLIGRIDERFKDVQDGIGSKFEKLGDRVNIALEPIGRELADFLIPLFEKIIPLAEDFGNTLSRHLQDNRKEIVQFRNAIVDLASAFTALGKISIPIISQLVQAAANGIGFYADLANAVRGDFSFRNSKGNFGNMLPGEEAPRNFRGSLGAPSRFAFFGAKSPPAAAGGAGGGGRAGAGGGRSRSAAGKTEVEQAVDTVKELNREIGVLREASSREFKLQIRTDELRETQRTLENIVDLRRKLNLLQVATPAGTEDAQLAALEFLSGKRAKNQTLAPLGPRADFKFIDDLPTPARPAAGISSEAFQRAARRQFGRSGAFIQDALSRGQLTGGEAELLRQGSAREFANQLREVLALKEKLLAVNDPLLEDLRDEIELYDRLGVAISDTERFMKGFNSQIDTVGDAFERFGANVSRAFTNVRDLFNGLKQAVLGFFNDLLGNALQNLVGQVLGPLFGGRGGGGGGTFTNLFRSLSPAGGASAPGSISLGPFGFGQGFGLGGGTRSAASGNFGNFIGASVPRTAGSIAKPSFLSGLGQSFAAAAPLLGLSFGASLGGASVGGQILGAAGGTLAGFAPTLLGLGSLLGPIGLAAAPLLLIGGALLGRAKQRKADEEAAGQMLTQAIQAITQLRDAIGADQIDGSQASAIFENQILGQFRAGINTLKTKSVRDSRLLNQVNDLRKVYQDNVVPQIAAQEARKAAGIAKQAQSQQNALIFAKQIPQFATGGTTMGGLAILHPGEKILNLQQQAAIRSMAGSNAFERAGVPGVSENRSFDVGGTMGGGGLPIEINLEAQVVIGKGDATRIFIVGGSTTQGRAVTVNNVRVAQTNREL